MANKKKKQEKSTDKKVDEWRSMVNKCGEMQKGSSEYKNCMRSARKERYEREGITGFKKIWKSAQEDLTISGEALELDRQRKMK
tara:strand:- start:135 stop:386 length:252 start_codon:yes stop_codon:yes gene_type:complete